MTESKKITKPQDDDENTLKRKQAQKLAYSKIQELLQRNVNKTTNKSFTHYTKDLLKQYVASAMANQQTLREVSRFLCRNSMIYQKLLMYYASMPLFYYNITQINDISKDINTDKSLKNYSKVLEQFEELNLKTEGYTSLYMALRDGFYVGFVYNSSPTGTFLMPLDVQYCRIYGKTPEGEWIVYFDASFFDKGDNKNYIFGVNNDGVGVWDECFIDGYNNYKTLGKDYQWFRLTPELTFCLLTCSDDDFQMPLPWYLPIFTSLLDLLDLETLLMSKTELENYILLVSKIPLINGSDDVDDFSLSLDLIQKMQSLIDGVVPDLVGTAYSPMDLEVIHFDKSNTTDDTDKLSQSINNLFNNAGASQLVVAGGSSSNSVGLKHAIENDMATCWVWVDKIQSWLNYFIKHNISDGYHLSIHHVTWYNLDDYQKAMKDAATLGASALDYLTSLGDSPYMVFQKMRFENAIDIKSLMIPLQSSYNTSSTAKAGRPSSKEDDLSEAGLKTKDGDKNGTETQ